MQKILGKKTELRKELKELSEAKNKFTTGEEIMKVMRRISDLHDALLCGFYIDDDPLPVFSGIKELGTFEIKSGAAMVSDFCYAPGTWCQGVLQNVKNGTWIAEQLLERNTPVCLFARHESAPKDYSDMVEEPYEIGVDSGTAGVYDLAEFQKDGKEAYSKKIQKQLRGPYVGPLDDRIEVMGIIVENSGAISRTAYGDGSYTCYTKRNDAGEVILIEIRFVYDEEDE